MDAESTWRLDLEYDGTRFSGWARQPGMRTVQELLERTLEVVLRQPVRLQVAGRTDAGVHAWAQVASFQTAAAVDPRRLPMSLNALLPDDVAVRGVRAAPPGWSARAARSRTYEYRLWLAPERTVRRYLWHVHGPVDREVLHAAAKLFVGRRDFSACTASAELYHHCIREVLAAEWTSPAEGREDELVLTVTAGGFLHSMVRIMVGTMVDAAQGRLALGDVEAALASGERRRMGRTAPARGLALIGVDYPHGDGEPPVV